MGQDKSPVMMTPEGTGKYLYELLINRCNIKESPISIDIDRLLPDEDFSKYEDSPAELILSMLLNYQKSLPELWNELLFQADSLGINKETTYLKTYFYTAGKSVIKSAIILKNTSGYFSFNFDIIDWEGKIYLLAVDNLFKQYYTLEELYAEMYAFDTFFLQNDRIPTSDSPKAYPYNEMPLLKVENTAIPSYGIISDEFDGIIQNKSHNNKLLISFTELNNVRRDTEGRRTAEEIVNELNQSWSDISKFIYEKKDISINPSYFFLSNLFYEDGYTYSASISYRFKFDNKNYHFSCYIILLNNEWKITEISPIEEETLFQF